MLPPVVNVVNVVDATKRYGSVVAVDRVSLRVDTGQIYALWGPNGAGTTTLIRMLLGMSRPTEGEVRLWGTPVGPDVAFLWSGSAISSRHQRATPS